MGFAGVVKAVQKHIGACWSMSVAKEPPRYNHCRQVTHTMSEDASKTEPMEKVIELSLPSKLGYERVAMDAATSLATRMGFHNDRVDALKTAISEAVTNAIEHGNQHDEEMKVVVLLTARESELVVSVADAGSKLLDSSTIHRIPDKESKYHPDAADRGGWGIWLIHELMDEVEITTAPGGGNQVRMVIHLER
jgi:serine/threonine-protein kinase RsbW